MILFTQIEGAIEQGRIDEAETLLENFEAPEEIKAIIRKEITKRKFISSFKGLYNLIDKRKQTLAFSPIDNILNPEFVQEVRRKILGNL